MPKKNTSEPIVTSDEYENWANNCPKVSNLMPDNLKDKIYLSSEIDPESIKTAKKMLFTAEEVTALIDEARREELVNLLELLDVEFAYYGGGKPYSEATGTVGHAPRIKKVIDNRIATLKKDTQDAR